MAEKHEEKIKKDNNKSQKFIKLKLIKHLKDHIDYGKITPILKDYIKNQKSNYFLNNYNISIGKLNSDRQFKLNQQNYFIKSHPKKLSIQRPLLKRISTPLKYSLNFHTFSNFNSPENNSKFKHKYSLSSGHMDKPKDSLELLKDNIVVDNKALKIYYDVIRKRINEEKKKKKDNNNLIKLPLTIKKSLIKQENIFKKKLKEKKNNDGY